MGRTVRVLALAVAMICGVSLTVSAQVKTITAKEYSSARAAADVATSRSYPREETYTYISDEPRDLWSRTRFQSAKRNYTYSTIKSGGVSEFTERVVYDGTILERSNRGIWKAPAPPSPGRGTGIGASESVYTLENMLIYGKPQKLYTETRTLPGGKVYTYWFRIDKLGRIVEYQDQEDFRRHMMIEYLKTLTPIKKPKLGSTEDVNP